MQRQRAVSRSSPSAGRARQFELLTGIATLGDNGPVTSGPAGPAAAPALMVPMLMVPMPMVPIAQGPAGGACSSCGPRDVAAAIPEGNRGGACVEKMESQSEQPWSL